MCIYTYIYIYVLERESRYESEEEVANREGQLAPMTEVGERERRKKLFICKVGPDCMGLALNFCGHI